MHQYVDSAHPENTTSVYPLSTTATRLDLEPRSWTFCARVCTTPRHHVALILYRGCWIFSPIRPDLRRAIRPSMAARSAADNFDARPSKTSNCGQVSGADLVHTSGYSIVVCMWTDRRSSYLYRQSLERCSNGRERRSPLGQSCIYLFALGPINHAPYASSTKSYESVASCQIWTSTTLS